MWKKYNSSSSASWHIACHPCSFSGKWTSSPCSVSALPFQLASLVSTAWLTLDHGSGEAGFESLSFQVGMCLTEICGLLISKTDSTNHSSDRSWDQSQLYAKPSCRDPAMYDTILVNHGDVPAAMQSRA